MEEKNHLAVGQGRNYMIRKPLKKTRKRLIIAFSILYGVCILLCFRIGWIQIVKGEEYSKMAQMQQTRDIPIEAKRGMIYDRNGKELAASMTCYSVWARPADVRVGKNTQEKDASVDKTAKILAEILKKDEEEIKSYLTKNQILVKVDKYLDGETADKIRKKKLPGIEIAEDVKRHYPLGPFLAHTLGSVTDDNTGLSGLELEYNQYLSGISGRWIKNTDVAGNSLAYGEEKYYQAEDGLGLVLTIDETIQHYVEKSLKTIQKNTTADRVMCVMTDPKTGDILAMGQTPEFDPNDAKTPLDKSEQAQFEKLDDSQKMDYWNNMWRNSLVSDVYEPGSTFKLLTTAMSLEEGEAAVTDHFNCGGSINVAGQVLKCWRHYNPHGDQSLKEAVGNSCNPVFVRLAQKMGKERFYNYMDTFGISEKTNIDFPGEANSLLQKDPGPVELSTMGYGQGVAVTPIQLITAVSSFGNEGKMMQPRLVKALVDEDGNTVREIDKKIIRQTVSKTTADEMCDIMEFVVDKGGAGTAKIDGYKVGGKTGTAQKVRSDGKGYSNDTDSSFIGMAPMDDPKVAILVVVDSPKGIKFGSQTAAPGAKMILQDTLRYLELQPKLTEEEKEKITEEQVTVPNLRGEGLEEAVGILGGLSLEYEASGASLDRDFIINDQYPKAGEKIEKDGTVYLYSK